MKKLCNFIILLFVLMAFSCTSSKPAQTDTKSAFEEPETVPELTDIQKLDDNKYTCSFDDIVHDFIIDLPDVVENAPLVIMLPGYMMTAESMRFEYAFEKEACKRGYAVVYVTGSVQKGDNIRTGIGWNSGLSSQGNKDVQFIVALAEYLQNEYGFDASRTFTAGFSNGAFMNHRLAMQAGNTFKACVSVAGKMTALVWNNQNEKNHVGFLQITGEKDDLIPKNSDGSSRFTKDPAIEDVMDYWAKSNGLENMQQQEIGNSSVLTKWSDESGQSGVQVWHIFIGGGHHSWPTQSIHGFSANTIILDFFDSF